MSDIAPSKSKFSIRPDHFCIVVDDLEAAIETYQSLGFTITEGAKASNGHNALIIFEDGIYIELMHFPKARLQRLLLALTKPIGLFNLLLSGDKEILRRFMIHWINARSGHWVDWSFIAEPLEAAVEHAHQSGIEITNSAHIHDRLNSTGDTAKWKMQGTLDTDLPFLIEDFPDSAPRAPVSQGHSHENGATALKEVILGSPNPERTLEQLAVFTGAKRRDDQLELNGIVFKCEYNPDRRYAGPEELILTTTGGSPSTRRITQLETDEARISLEV